MALQITGKGISIKFTGQALDGAYLRIKTTNEINGKKQAQIVAFLSKEHYKNLPKLKLAQSNIPIDITASLTPVETDDVVKAHELFKEQFEAAGYEVNITDLD